MDNVKIIGSAGYDTGALYFYMMLNLVLKTLYLKITLIQKVNLMISTQYSMLMLY